MDMYIPTAMIVLSDVGGGAAMLEDVLDTGKELNA